MQAQSLLKCYAYAAITTIALAGLGTPGKSQETRPQNLPSYMAPISGRTVSSPADTAVKNVLALNTAMFELYDDAAKIFQRNVHGLRPEKLRQHAISFTALEPFARKQAPYLRRDIAWAAQTQVADWMKVIADWKKMFSALIGRRPMPPATRSMHAPEQRIV
jgi:hypothetical protein